MKQMGSGWAKANGLTGKGDELAQIPPDLRVREFPQSAAQAALAAGGQAECRPQSSDSWRRHR
jgi:hypothetical protein